MKKNTFIFVIFIAITFVISINIFSRRFIPVPADTIQGLYYPFRDISTAHPNGVPNKNSLITDPIRQQFPWKFEATRQIKNGEWPLWNPYNFSGTPLLANIQSGVLYPLNIIFFIPTFSNLPLHTFAIQWSGYIYLQSILGFYFMYLYLRKTGLTIASSLFGAIAWIFSGYMTSWWEWGNIGHTIIWMPLLFWSIEKYTEESSAANRSWWQMPSSLIIFLGALTASFLAGHWQSFSFVIINTFFYAMYRISPFIYSPKPPFVNLTRRRLLQWSQLTVVGVLFMTITALQWLPSLEFLQKSAREIDPTQWQRQDWFFPDAHFIGLLAPDFFGNPSTQNYWGVWNYGEFSSYVGIAPLLFALSIACRWIFQQTENRHKRNNTLDVTERNIGVGFFLFCIIINLVLITRNPLSELPYKLNLPFVSTTQPSRGIVMIDFSLAVLAAVGLHYFIKNLQRRTAHPNRAKDVNSRNVVVLYAAGTLTSVLLFLWVLVSTTETLFPTINSSTTVNNIQIAKNNLIIPTLITASIVVLLFIIKTSISQRTTRIFTHHRLTKLITTVPFIIIAITLLDLSRFFLKFNTFTDTQYLYPSTPLTSPSTERYMTDDSRIIAPNINMPYQLRTVDGYDPLYFDHYGKFIGMWVRNQPDLTPFPANRILTPHAWDSHLADIAATQQLYSFNQLDNPELTQISEYGMTKLYKRTTALSQLTILPDLEIAFSEQQVADAMFNPPFNPQTKAIVLIDKEITDLNQLAQGSQIAQSEGFTIQDTHQIITQTQTANYLKAIIHNYLTQPALLYRAESFDEGWQVYLDGKPTQNFRTNFSFQGIIVPSGTSTVEFRYQPQSFYIGSIISIVGLAVTGILIVVKIKKTAGTGI